MTQSSPSAYTNINDKQLVSLLFQPSRLGQLLAHSISSHHQLLTAFPNMDNSNDGCPGPAYAIVWIAMAIMSLSFTCTRHQRTIECLEERIEHIASLLRNQATSDRAQTVGELDEPMVNGRVIERGGSARENGAGDSGFPGLE